MKKLVPKVEGKEIEYINKTHIYVRVMDHGEISILKEIIIGPGQHTWFWVPFKVNKSTKSSIPVDLSPREYTLTTFDEAINHSIRSPFCVIYEFDDCDDMWGNLDNLIYDDTPPTVYKSREEEK
jgi:hypothetical protein